jgi:uncharacterized membrane protein YccC
VITAVIVMQASLGGSLKASFDRLVGTIGGAICGGVVVAVLPRGSPWDIALALALALLPLSVLAAIDSRFRVAPVTAAILILVPAAPDVGPLAFTADRILEIALGGIVAVVVSLVILPARAHYLLAEAVSRLLLLLADFLPLLLDHIAAGADSEAVAEMQVRTRKALASLEGAAEEARRERRTHLTDDPDPDPIVRTAMRLRNDLTIVARATAQPLPGPIQTRLAPAIQAVSATGAGVFRGTATAFSTRSPPPSLDEFAAALADFSAAIADIRRKRLTQALPADSVGRLFALGFALEQLREDLGDMVARSAEFSQEEPASARLKP